MLDGDFQDRAGSLQRLILGQTEVAVPIQTAQLVIEQHRTFWAFQRDLVESLVTEKISRFQYLENFNDGLSELTRIDRQILGDRAYTAIFGPVFDAADSMIDAETFLVDEPNRSPDAEPQAGAASG